MESTLSIPVTLVPAGGKYQLRSILEVTVDGTATTSEFQRQLAVGLSKSGKLLGELKFRGNDLLSDSRIHHYAAANSKHPRFTATYTATRDCSTKGLLFVKTADGKVASLVYRQDLTVTQLKRQVYQKLRVQPIQQRLLLDSKLLGDGKTLQASGVQPGSVLHLMLPVTGGLSTPPFQFPDVTDNAALQRVPFQSSAPTWRQTNRGLNLEGMCNNAACEAFGNLAIYPAGYCNFSLKADKAKCPCCKIQIEPLTCAFTDCWWLYDGRKATAAGPQDVTGAWQEVESDAYYRFREADNGIDWYSLVLSARPRPALYGALGKGTIVMASKCTICWDPEPLLNAAWSTIDCGHSFHSGCLKTWWKHMPESGCPICRLKTKNSAAEPLTGGWLGWLLCRP